jgi:protein SCO1/2
LVQFIHNHHSIAHLLLAAASVTLLQAGAAHAQRVQDSVAALQKINVVEHLGDTIPMNLTFTNDEGQQVQLSQYFHRGKPVILVLAYYTCPMLCTLVLNGVANGMQGLEWTPGQEFTVLTISIDPKETAELAAAKKARYLESLNKPGADAGWHFFVGESSQSKALADAVGFEYYYMKDKDQYAHPAVIFVLTENGVISRYLYGLEYKPADLKLALLEASEGKIGSTVDRLILYCYHYDPDAGTYTLFAANVMRVGGAITFLFVIVVVGSLWLWERRRKAKRIAAAH